METVEAPSPRPAVTVPASDTRVIYAPRRTGDGFVPVTLRKLEGGYLGPQGEFYPTMPRVILLTEMYGAPEELQQTRTDVFFIHIPNRDGRSFTRVTLTRRDNGFIGPPGGVLSRDADCRTHGGTVRRRLIFAGGLERRIH